MNDRAGRTLMGIGLLVGGPLVSLSSVVLALFVFAASASHGGGESLGVGFLGCAVVALAGVAMMVGGVVTLVTKSKQPPGG